MNNKRNPRENQQPRRNKSLPSSQTNYNKYCSLDKIIPPKGCNFFPSKCECPPGSTGCIRTFPENGCAVAEGTGTNADGYASHAEGLNTTASNVASHAEGAGTTASGYASHAEGFNTIANGTNSHAEGEQSKAVGTQSHAEGHRTTASGYASHAEGRDTTASGASSHTEGLETAANGDRSHAEGRETKAFGENSHTEGQNTTTGDASDPNQGLNAHAEGEGNTANGRASHAEGGAIDQFGNLAPTLASGQSAHAEGIGTIASGFASHAEGIRTTAIGECSHTEGEGTIASGSASHAEGAATNASENFSHAEGLYTTADGLGAHAEGYFTNAYGHFGGAHAEGSYTTASGDWGAHAEGYRTTASGDTSHAEGWYTTASGTRSHAEGRETKALHEGAHIMGSYGDSERDYSWFLANGTSNINKGLAAKILNNGEGHADIGWFSGGADYAELFETTDGNSIEPGYFVTLAEDKIRKATNEDDFVLGVISANPGFVGNTGEFHWQGKYLKDEWGRVQYEDVTIDSSNTKFEEKINELHSQLEQLETQLGEPYSKDRDPVTMNRPALNPKWDPNQKYIPRLQRPEWCVVCLMGQILVRDDGTCQPGSYCKPNEDGIATHSTAGYRVMKRVGPNQVLILFR